MFPILFTLGPFPVHSYGFMLALAVLVSSWLFARAAAAKGISSEIIYDLVFWVVLAGIMGARLFFILLNLSYFVREPLEMVMIQNGGLAWQGSFVGGVAMGVFYIRKKNLSLWDVLDTAAPFIALGHAIGRIGCLLNGCCFGHPVAWGLFFPVMNARLFPVQILMVVGQLIVFYMLRSLQQARAEQSPFLAGSTFRLCARPGGVFIVYLLLSSLERFIVEFFRADHEVIFGLSIFQYVCAAIFVVAVGLFFKERA